MYCFYGIIKDLLEEKHMANKTVLDFMNFIKENNIPLDSEIEIVLDNDCKPYLTLTHKTIIKETEDFICTDIDTFYF